MTTNNKEFKKYKNRKVELEIQDETDLFALRTVGVIYNTKGYFEKAAKIFNILLEIEPEYSGAWLGIGEMYQAQKKFDLAESSYKKGLNFDPLHASMWERLAYLYGELGKKKEAKEATKKMKNALEMLDRVG